MTNSQSRDDLVAAARSWIEGDPDPESRAELEAVLDREDFDDLAERMAGTLHFGTAGLRGIVGAGSNRMNRAVIIRATRGLADYLLAAEPGLVVVGRDARLSSPQFLEDTVAVLAAAGLAVHYFEGPVPTPAVAYAVRVLGARAGIMITASHNPADYNGYKVYAPNAVQIVSPVDRDIAQAIDRVGAANQVPRLEDPLHAEGVERIDDALIEQYYGDLEVARAGGQADPDMKVVYTPLHGVGWRFFAEAAARAGYRHIIPVPAQVEPDGSFPTTHFPNPEEPGAMDLAMELGQSQSADMVLANDPDADRLAVAVPTGNGWVRLSGNQVGCLLADYVLQHAPSEPRPIVVESIVSSPMLGAIAEAYGARFEQTLTGFKWIWNAALDLEAAGEGRFVFGYEEALGYSVGRAVRDKDGITAATVFADLASACKKEGISVGDRLAALYRRFGLWVSTQKSIVRPGREGAEHRPRWLGATPLVALELEGQARVLVRPSGTEPKLKIYVDLRADLSEGDDVQAVERTALDAAQGIAEETAAFVGLS